MVSPVRLSLPNVVKWYIGDDRSIDMSHTPAITSSVVRFVENLFSFDYKRFFIKTILDIFQVSKFFPPLKLPLISSSIAALGVQI